MSDMMDTPEPKPRKGSLPVGVIASIQAVYANEQHKQDQLRGIKPGLELADGWGGNGR